MAGTPRTTLSENTDKRARRPSQKVQEQNDQDTATEAEHLREQERLAEKRVEKTRRKRQAAEAAELQAARKQSSLKSKKSSTSTGSAAPVRAAKASAVVALTSMVVETLPGHSRLNTTTTRSTLPVGSAAHSRFTSPVDSTPAGRKRSSPEDDEVDEDDVRDGRRQRTATPLEDEMDDDNDNNDNDNNNNSKSADLHNPDLFSSEDEDNNDDNEGRLSMDNAANSEEAVPSPLHKGKRKRPTRSAQTFEIQTLYDLAQDFYRGYIVSENAFPSDAQEGLWSMRAWERANEELDMDTELTKDLRTLIINNACHLRGQLKTKAKSIVPTAYGFAASPDDKIKAANRQLAKDLRDQNAFVYREREEGLSKIYLAPAIQQLVNEAFYADMSDNGIKREEFFRPFPKNGLALVCTVLACAIDEWVNGSYKKVPFTENAYEALYITFVENVNKFEQRGAQQNLMNLLLTRIHENGRAHAGATAAPVEEAVMHDEAVAWAVADLAVEFGL